MLCRPGYFGCDNMCQPLSKLCDGRQDCYDGTDEKGNCNGTVRRVYQVTHIGVDERTINETSFIITWWIPVPSNTTFEFLPSISTIGTDKWQNHSSWLTTPHHQFLNLKPFTNYNVTVYVRIKDVPNDIFIPYLYSNITTSEGVPTEPLNVTVQQVNGSRIRVSWSPPLQIYGVLTAYSVHFRKESINIEPTSSVKVNPQETSTILISNFEGNKTYLFWVKAKNSKHESPASKMLRLAFDNLKNLDNLQGVRVQSQTIDSVTLVWEPVPSAEGYNIQPVLPQFYPRIDAQKTNGTTITIHNLVPGTQYIFKVSAYKNSYFGRTTNIPVDRSNYGSQLPTIQIDGHFMDNGSISLRWSAPKLANYNQITYGVYYGTSLDELFNCKYRFKFIFLLIIFYIKNEQWNPLSKFRIIQNGYLVTSCSKMSSAHVL